MPISLSGIDSGNTQFGIGTYLAIADRTAAGTSGDRTDVDDFHKIRYQVQTVEIAGNAPGIEVPIIGSSPSAFPTQQGPLDIINGFTFPAYVQQMEPIYRNLLNDSRVSTDVGSRLAAQTGTPGGSITAGATPTAAPGSFNQPAADSFPIRFSVDPTTAGTLYITGKDGNGDPTSETMVFGSTTAEKSARWYSSIDYVSGTTGSTTFTQSADAVDRPFNSTFKGRSDSRLLYGNDIFVLKGDVPNTYREVFIDSLSFTLSRDGAVAFTIGCVGKRPIEHRWIDGAAIVEPKGTTTSAESFRRLDSSDDPVFPIVTRTAFTGWQGGLFFGDDEDRLPLIEGTVTISNNLAFTPTISGRRRPGATFRNRRNVTLSGTMEYRADDAALINDVLSGDFLESTYLRLQNASGGFPYRARFNFGRLQFTNVPSAPVTEEGVIARPIDMISVDSADGSAQDVEIQTWVQNPITFSAISLS